MGILSRWSWPDIDGLKNFKGTLVHSANWDLGGATWEDDAKDWQDKNVAVIGLGSTALQIVAALHPKVGKLYNFGRGKAWISPPFAVTKFSELLSRDVFSDENYVFSEEEKERLDDPVFGRQFRHALEQDMNSLHTVTMRNSPLQQQVQVWFKAHMIHRLAKKPEIAEKLIPDFSVTCRRLTPAPGYLDALCQENVELIISDIEHVTSDTVETKDGNQTKLDVIICATGFDSSYRYPFPIIGRDGVDLCDKWTPTAKTYLSVCVDGFPNCFFGLGPNSTIGTGSLIPMIEHQVDYAVQVAMKLQRERLKSIEVKKRAVEDFDRFIETVFTEKVRTWYKLGKEEGRVVGLWPGSTLHALKALKYPRWEDFNYEQEDGESSHNSLYWLGNGMTNNEKTLTGDRAWYLSKEYMDVPSIPTATIKNKV
ncbi:hypothetical protein PHLCEN_2v10435 [Hermanssonia centrifuga]|uniref:Uncharacterized protein n=1 Tax=Hermanssonia centrifuga TaxID=98765 RepID=A0A2R6NMY7_9APHY|nr:hypothetical protein PHLCEN_2v10435 [Hermanssonia centrifuga]